MENLTEQHREDMEYIMHYLIESVGEAKDFYGREKDDRSNHIYNRIVRIANAMGGAPKELVDYYHDRYEDEEEEVCPLCNELEELHDWNKTEEWTGEPEFREKMGVSRCCCDCRHGLKDRECEDCGMTYNPRQQDTFMKCGMCYDAERPKCDECECRECECDEE